MASFQVPVFALAFLVFVQISSRSVHCTGSNEDNGYRSSSSPCGLNCGYDCPCKSNYGCGYIDCCSGNYGSCSVCGCDKYPYECCGYGCGNGCQDICGGCCGNPCCLCFKILPDKDYSCCGYNYGKGYAE